MNFLILPSVGQWVNVYSGFFDWDFQNQDDWKTPDNKLAEIYNCNINQMDVIYLDCNFRSIQKTFINLPPHYEVKIQADLYFLFSWDSEIGSVYIDNTQIFSRLYQVPNMASYNNQCSDKVITDWNVFMEIKTAESTISHSSTSLTLKFTHTLDEVVINEFFAFRNVQLWVNRCHETCASCNGGSSSNCLSCFGASLIGGQCRCLNEQFPFLSPQQVCQRYCGSHEVLSGNSCYYENRINEETENFIWSYYTIPISDEGWSYFQDQIQIPFQFYNCEFYFQALIIGNTYIQKQITLNPTTTYINLLFIHHFYYYRYQYQALWITFDDELIDVIYFDNGIMKSLNSIITPRGLVYCQRYSVSVSYVTQQKIKWAKQTVLIKISSNFVPNSFYGMRSLRISQISCTTYCTTCLNDSKCQICNSGYYLLQGQCVTSCPLHSSVSGSNCIDQSDETPYTSYLLKAFYLETSPNTEATDYFSLISSSGTNFVKGVHYSYLRNKRIFGGALTWFSAKFRGTYTISVPHYQVRVKMLVVLGDNFGNGQFQYSINGGATYTITRGSSATDIHQEWGDTYSEYFYQVNELTLHTSSTLTVDVECIGDTSRAINEAFCGIANYFITINECPPLCTACTSLGSCTSWITQANFDSSTHACKPGYHEDYATRSCLADPVCGNGIKEDGEHCDDGNEIEFDGCYECKFSCSQNEYPYCPLIKLKKKQNCSSGYYLNQFNNMCYPLCGDNIIVGDEECEDNNLVPFDGCHQCKYQCQESCKTCTKGVCFQCKSGWSLTSSKRCEPICKDGIKEFDEECDDKIYADQNKCDNCKFSCPDACSSCSYGVCLNCQTGFNLNKVTNKCIFIPSDQVITKYEQCDDGNYYPFDVCYLNQYTCQSSCLECNNGKCYKCKSGFALNLQTHLCTSICGDNLVRENEVCDDKNSLLFDKCYNCAFSCPDKCVTCNYGICQACLQGYYLNLQLNKCQSYCGDTIQVDNEECDDGNLIPYDGCHNCKFQCQQSCLECRKGLCYKCQVGWKLNEQLHRCTSICGDGMITTMETCEDGIYSLLDICYQCQFSCPTYCSSCLYGRCLTCQKGFQLDKSSNACKEICGDKDVVGQEECDDGNLIPYDGCHNCKFQCQQSCLECRKGLCYKCQVGWKLNEQLHRCTSICGDGMITTTETCEDGIYSLLDICYQCQFSCPTYCSSCLYGRCLTCQNGFQLDKSSNACKEICGDKDVVGQEECDDGNLIPYDGCHECKYQCQDYCLECRKGKCYRCEQGWQLNKQTHQCDSICGDQYLNRNEVCDESIYQLYDYCEQCQFACPLNCLNCQYGKCTKCQEGFMLDKSTNECVEICGDGIRVGQEECDDGNLISHDGCHDCKYQCQRSCIECQNGKCLRCQIGWALNSRTHLCQPICDDSIQVEVEECDSGPYNLFNNCSSCKLSCSSDCQVCSYGVCKTCKTGFLLDESTNECISICGDGIITKYEECDDADFKYDNCVNCQLKCQDSCLECIKGKCYRCKQGWQWNKQTYKCDEICGDAVLVGSEVCDDNNGSLLDQCYQCQFSCSSDCLHCSYGKCIECKSGYNLTLSNQCEAICGDGIVAGTEECDDGNLISFDGCHHCKFQCGYGCKNCINGLCENCAQSSGWVLQEPVNNCESVCGDGITAGWELCDQSDTDICSNCILVCDPICATCEVGVCTSCIEGYWLFEHSNQCISPKDCPINQGYQSITETINNVVIQKCQSICGDGIVTSDEECDYGLDASNQCINCKLKCPDNCLICKYGICSLCEFNFTLNTKANTCYFDCLNSNLEQCETQGTECTIIENKCSFKEFYCEDYNRYDILPQINDRYSPCNATLEGYKCILENKVCRSMLCSDLEYCDSTQLTIIGFNPILNKCYSAKLENGNQKCIEKPIHCFLCQNKDCCFEALDGKCKWQDFKCEIVIESQLLQNRVSIYKQSVHQLQVIVILIFLF